MGEGAVVRPRKATSASSDGRVIICFSIESCAEIWNVTRDGMRISAGFLEGTQGVPAAADALALRATRENFPVALRFLPGRYRRHLMAVYGFARTADDIGDQAPAGDRLRLLDELQADLIRLYAQRVNGGEGGAGPFGSGGSGGYGGKNAGTVGHGGQAEQPRIDVIRALGPAVAECGIPMQPFVDLIRANQQDQVVSEYRTFDDLLGYCRLSANPVGRIVLYVFGSYSEPRAEQSDAICTALQLAEHWQDVAEDLRAGRVYLPADDMERYGCSARDLAAGSAGPPVRALIAFEVARARALLDTGAPLIGSLRGAARAAVAGYVAGGRAALAAIAGADYDVLSGTPVARRRRVAGELALAYTRGR
jgi:squalene synthase HpnC